MFFFFANIGEQVCLNQVCNKISERGVSSVFNLTAIFQLIVHRLDK
jgi:hypothetical protein